MWDSLKPEFLARLPHSPEAGAMNGTPGSVKPAPPSMDWEACLAELDHYRTYTGDWDGQGEILGKPAKDIPADVVDSAVALMRSLRSHAVPAPNATYPGVGGSVGVVWDIAGGGIIELEVVGPGTADVYLVTADKKVEHLILTEAVTA
jgi:hypothetical protein